MLRAPYFRRKLTWKGVFLPGTCLAPHNTIDEWIYFLKNEEIKDEFKARGIQEAKKELDILKMPEEERQKYEAYMEDLRYQASMYESSYKVGEMKGKKEGKEEGIKEGQGLSISDIEKL